MEQLRGKKKTGSIPSWEDPHVDMAQMYRWRDSAFQVAVEKLREGHDMETVMQTGEAFGRGLFSQKIHEKPVAQSVVEWLRQTEEEVLRPFGSEFIFTKVSDDVTTAFMNRDPLRCNSRESVVASLFTYGVMRGLFLSAFPDGELLFREAGSDRSPEFVFKAYASLKDRCERERVKHAFSVLKKV